MIPNEADEHGGTAGQRPSDDDLSELEALRERVDDLDAAVQAIRGLLGEVMAVDRDVERRADLALSRTDRLRDRLDAVAAAVDGVEHDDPPPAVEDSGGTDGATEVDAAGVASSGPTTDVTGCRSDDTDPTAGYRAHPGARPDVDDDEVPDDATDPDEEWGLAERLRETL